MVPIFSYRNDLLFPFPFWGHTEKIKIQYTKMFCVKDKMYLQINPKIAKDEEM